MSTIRIIDNEKRPMCQVSPSIASRMEGNFEVARTTDPNVRRFLTPEEQDQARAAHVRKVTGLAHPHDRVSDETIEQDFDAWVSEQGPDVFV